MGVSAGTTLNQGKGEALIVEEGSLEIHCTEVKPLKPNNAFRFKSVGQANRMSSAQ